MIPPDLPIPSPGAAEAVTDELREGPLDKDSAFCLMVLDLVADRDRLFAMLPEADQREYLRCQQSVIDARRSANRVEGQMWIG